MEVKLAQETCVDSSCGVTFWVDVEFKDILVRTKRSFYCPNGHSMNYRGESDASRALRLQQEKDQMEQRKDAEIARLKREVEAKTNPPNRKRGRPRKTA